MPKNVSSYDIEVIANVVPVLAATGKTNEEIYQMVEKHLVRASLTKEDVNFIAACTRTVYKTPVQLSKKVRKKIKRLLGD